MKKSFLLAALALLISFTACKPKEEPSNISVNPTELIFAGGSDQAVSLKTSSVWASEVDVDWLTITPASGKGDATIKVHCTPGEAAETKVVFYTDEGSATLVVKRATKGDMSDQDKIDPENEDQKTLMAVDLGLSSGTLWANMNVGAKSPDQEGDYFAWADVAPKEKYKDGHLDAYYLSDLYKMLPQFDAAFANMGETWFTPTQQEMQELIDECTWTWKEINCQRGALVTGPNGNAIFLPAVGYKDQYGLNGMDRSGHYMTSSDREGSQTYQLSFSHADGVFSKSMVQSPCYYGLSVRAVYHDDKPALPFKGRFSVGPGKQVEFSRANVVRHKTTGEWSFDKMLGLLYGLQPDWEEYEEYFDKNDWSDVAFDSDQPGAWRLLRPYEWRYLLFERPNASSLVGWGRGDAGDMLIILPDNWVTPDDVFFKSAKSRGFEATGTDEYSEKSKDHYEDNHYYNKEWLIMEAAGAIFLRARDWMTDKDDVPHPEFGYGYYMMTFGEDPVDYEDEDEDDVFADLFQVMGFDRYGLKLGADPEKSPSSCSVRLVKDVK